MKVGQHVEYQTGWGEESIGLIVAIDEAAERITVIDKDDGSKWRGPMDRATVVQD